MASTWPPLGNADFDAWMSAFNTYFQANFATWGFGAPESTAVLNAYNDWHAAFIANQAAQAAAEGAAQTQQNERQTSMDVIRPLVKQVQANPATTDIHRAGLGVNIPDPRTPAQVPPTAPFIELDWSQRGQVTIHVGETPSNEQINKFGEFAQNVALQFKLSGGNFEHLGVTSHSPFVHVVGNTTAQTVEYRAAYLNSKGEQGPWSEVDDAYVGVAA